MKKIYSLSLFALFVLVLSSCGVNRNVYTSADFEEQAGRHRTVAILPFRIIQTGHLSRGTKEEDVKRANDKLSLVFQESLHAHSLRQTARNRKCIIVSFQSTVKTNALLKEAGLTTESLYDKTPEDIAELPGVDALLWKTFRAGGTDLASSVDGLVEYYSNWIAKKLPYRN